MIERAAAAGVGIIVNPGIDLASCRRVLALAEHYPNIYAAVGVHPNDCADFSDDTLVALRELAQHPKVVAIGEIGLDYYWEKVAHDQQKLALRAQLALAAELKLPVILHSRNPQGGDSRQCNADLLLEIERLPKSPADFGSLLGVWHAFSGDPSTSSGQALAEAQAAYDLGLALGLGGPVTFQNARRLHALIPQLRLDRLLLETDAPYLAPHPYRGQRNEPAYVPLIAQSLAKLFGVTPEAVADQTTETTSRVFGRGVGHGQDG